MIIIFVVFSIASILVFVLYAVGFLLSIKLNMLNKNTAFESGFLSIGLVQNSFSIHFFIIMLMFVIFDLEIVMFLGVLISDLNSIYSFLLLIFFILSGFYMEWYYGKLLWAI